MFLDAVSAQMIESKRHICKLLNQADASVLYACLVCYSKQKTYHILYIREVSHQNAWVYAFSDLIILRKKLSICRTWSFSISSERFEHAF